MDLFRVRLNCIDNYQAIPTTFDPVLKSHVKPADLHKQPKVPVIRVFGATETGQKVCAHIHGAFPYLYIAYQGSLTPDEVSYRRSANDGKAKFVARITLVKAIPFYGFHVGFRYYLKIYMLNPMTMTRLADLLRQGVVMRTTFQPFEAHLQYLLQWMIDYSLYGCAYINCAKVKFRSPVPSYEEMSDQAHLWHDQSIKNAWITPEATLPRVSHCSIEVDICVQDILNRQDIKPRSLHHDFTERLNPLAPDEKLVASMAGLWRDETRRRKAKMSNATPGSSPFPAEVMISMSADPRNTQPGGWIHEDEFRQKMAMLISDERSRSDGLKVNFDNFVRPASFDSLVRTTLESVEDLYPENLMPALGITSSTGSIAGNYDLNEFMEKEVDEQKILGLDNSHDEVPGEDEVYDTTKVELDHIALIGQTNMGLLYPQQPKDTLSDAKREQAAIQHTAFDPDINLSGVSFPSDLSNGTSSQAEMDTTAKITEAHQTAVQSTAIALEKHAKRPLNLTFESAQDAKRPRLVDDPTDDVRGLGEHLQDEAEKYDVATDSNNTNVSEPTTSIWTAPRHQRIAAAPKLGTVASLKTKSHGARPLRGILSPERLRNGPSINSQPGSQKSKHVVFTNGPSLQSSASYSRGTAATVSPCSPASPRGASTTKLMDAMRRDYPACAGSTVLMISSLAPLKEAVTESMVSLGLDPVIYQDAYYSQEADVPERAREWAGKEFRLESTSVPFLPGFEPFGNVSVNGKKPFNDREQHQLALARDSRRCTLRSWSLERLPPSYASVATWQAQNERSKASCTVRTPAKSTTPRKAARISQIDGLTQKNKHGFKYTQGNKSSSIRHEAQYMSTMSLEVHINTRRNLVPDPEQDEIQCIFWCLQTSGGGGKVDALSELLTGIIVLSEQSGMAEKISTRGRVEIVEESSELGLLNTMIDTVRMHDPDILTGYEVHGGSWGYLIERARFKYDYNLCDEFSRMRAQSHGRFGKDADRWGFNNTSTIRVTGRHMINIWRAMRSELNLLQYTMENVVFHILHRRIPHHTWADLTAWYMGGKPKDLARVVKHYISRAMLDLEILEKNELIPRTSEQARLLGVDFFAVFSRGSQFKVESLMFRIAKPENFMLVSPSRKQVGGQNALECLPLVMEPQSAFYNSPLLVLDFQSLYPSVMIAYNYCYSTFLGRIVDWRGTNKMGFTEYKRQHRLLELLKDYINIAPNGMMYARPEIRKSLLAKMLGEILETRVMVKSGMKIDKQDKALQRLLNNRQLALKLIANVTYGYTSASFSGRMPCSEIADSIVQTGRETLERAIALIHSVKRWGAEVVYGDTDSLFVYLKGRTKDQAFNIGDEIAKAVTNMNPRPVKLKFEKVYLPCVLLAKKRYVGFKYEHRDQKEPDFDAKGIETVRRDGTPAEQKIEEKALKILFRTADLSQVKAFFQGQCEKIMRGSVSIQDFCFAKEVKLGTYSDKGPPPPGAMISTRRMLQDARAEPQYGERVPYVVITGAPGARLIDRCVSPEELLENEHCELDSEYYISKNLIPPLERIFNLMGANVRAWYDEMPKIQRVRRIDAGVALQLQAKEAGISKKTLESYLRSTNCLVCGEKLESEEPLCGTCQSDHQGSLLTLQTRLNAAENSLIDIQRVCQSCSELPPLAEVRCDSKDCPVFYTRMRQAAKLRSEKRRVQPVIDELSAENMVDNLAW